MSKPAYPETARIAISPTGFVTYAGTRIGRVFKTLRFWNNGKESIWRHDGFGDEIFYCQMAAAVDLAGQHLARRREA